MDTIHAHVASTYGIESRASIYCELEKLMSCGFLNPFPFTEISKSAHAFSAICGAFFLDVSQTAVTAVLYDAVGL